MIIVLQNFLFSKEFPACSVRFGLFSKIKKEPGANFWWTFSAWFFYENVPYLILYQWTKFQCHNLFLSQDIKQNVSLSSYSDICDVIDFKIFLESTSKAKVDRERRGEDRNTKIWISWERKELFRWNKRAFFIVFEGLSFDEQ